MFSLIFGVFGFSASDGLNHLYTKHWGYFITAIPPKSTKCPKALEQSPNNHLIIQAFFNCEAGVLKLAAPQPAA